MDQALLGASGEGQLSIAVFLSFLSIGMFLLSVLLALALGRSAERMGALVCAGGGVLTLVAQGVAVGGLPYLAFLSIDCSMAIAFGVLALRFPEKLWPGVAGVAQTLVVTFSATRALHFPLSEAAYTAALNLSSLAVGLSLAGGTIASRWSRRRTEDELLYA
jgi:hypothetical protein